jgi:hypothetical protein
MEILRRVDSRIKSSLQQDTDSWRLLNTCPACCYKLQDEPPLEFSLLCQMDGNNSLKRTDTMIRANRERIDCRQAQSDYWLKPEGVDIFKDEVKVFTSSFCLLAAKKK